MTVRGFETIVRPKWLFGTLTAAQDFFGDTPSDEAVEVPRGRGWPAFDHRRLTGLFDTGTAPEVRPYPEEASRELAGRDDSRPDIACYLAVTLT